MLSHMHARPVIYGSLINFFSSPSFSNRLVLVAFFAEFVKVIADEQDWWKVGQVNDFNDDFSLLVWRSHTMS